MISSELGLSARASVVISKDSCFRPNATRRLPPWPTPSRWPGRSEKKRRACNGSFRSPVGTRGRSTNAGWRSFDELTIAPTENGVLVIDEHGDRKWGKRTAHVGRQWLANIGKTDNGVVSVTSLWADEGVYWPIDFEPYTPSHHFEGGKNDSRFRTKLKIASELVEMAVGRGSPFRAVVADSF